MPDAADLRSMTTAILAPAEGPEAFAAIPDPAGDAGRETLLKIAAKIGRTRRPGSRSSIPAGATYLAQFVAHDLDFRSPEDPAGAPRLDLAVLYGDGPRHDAFAYQVPQGPGLQRSLLRLGRARPADDSPAWGAARDLPRASCPHLDAQGVEARSEVLTPNTASDSNLMLGQVQTLWALLHNALVAGLAEAHPNPRDAFEAARRITRLVYRGAVLNDLLGTWLLPALRPRYAQGEVGRLSTEPLAAMPRAYLTGVARLGHGLVREIYALNDRRPAEGLRSLIRHTSSGRPGDMPLTEDWLLDFALFFDMNGHQAQRARGLGPHVARPFAPGGGVGLDAPSPSDGLVLRDLVACTRSEPPPRGDMPTVRTLVARIEAASPGFLEGCFAQDESLWTKAVADWLSDAGLPPETARALAADPPLTLFLMLEAEADNAGQTLGALGSVLMAETLTGALPAPAPAEDLAQAQALVFRGDAPASMAELVLFLQRHYHFAEGARLHPADLDRKPPITPSKFRAPEATMLDDQNATNSPTGLVQVADYIELGRLVADWTRNAESRPKDIAELTKQLDGIAVVPEAFKAVKFVESEPEVLTIRLPEATLTQATMTRMEALLVGDRYMLPKFYDDIYNQHFGPVMSPLDTFLARIGDYTIAQCR